MPRRDRPSRREIAKQRSEESFVGRAQVLGDFERNLRLPLEERHTIWFVSGQGGVGKSTLMRRFKAQIEERGGACAMVDESIPGGPVEIMDALARQLEELGVKLKDYRERFEAYQRRRAEIDADPDARQTQSMEAFGRAGARVAKAGVDMIPGASLVTAAIGEEAIQEAGASFARYLSRKFGPDGKDDVELVLNPLPVLAPLFVESLSEAAEKHLIAIFIDTYEQTAKTLEGWLVALLACEYGDLDLNVLIGIAGRYPLGQEWQRPELRPFVQRIELEPFTEEEAREFLAKRGVLHAKAVETLLRISGRVPVLLATFAEQMPDDPEDIGAGSSLAIDRFLRWVGEENQRQALLTCALPRRFDRDVVAVLLGPEEADAHFHFITGMEFVRQLASGQWAYHDVVRELLLRYRLHESREKWDKWHISLAEFHEERRQSLGLTPEDRLQNEAWHSYAIESIYHRACVGRNRAVLSLMSYLIDVIELRRYDFPPEAEAINITLLQVAEEGADPAVRTWVEQIAPIRSVDDDALSLARFVQLFRSAEAVADELSPHQEALRNRLLAHACIGLNEYDMAVKCLSRAIELEPLDATAWNNRGALLRDLERYDEALIDLNKAVELDRKDAVIWRNRADTFAKLARYDEAIADYTESISLDPENPARWVCRAEVWTLMERIGEAIADYRRAVDLEPENPTYLIDRGALWERIDNDDAALSDFERAIQLNPADATGWIMRGVTLFKLGRYQEALSDYEKAIQLAPNYALAWSNRGFFLYMLGRYEDALASYEKAVELDPQDPITWNNRGNVLEWLGRLQDALKSYDIAISLAPDSGLHPYWRGLTHLLMRHFDEAMHDLNRAVELDQGMLYKVLTLIWKGVIAAASSQYEAAQESWREALNGVATLPESDLPYRTHALIQLLFGHFEEALAGYRQVLAANPFDPRSPQRYLRVLRLILVDRSDIAEMADWFDSEVTRRWHST